MKIDSIIYRTIAAQITLMGYTRRTIADMLGVSYGTLHNKLCGYTPFTWNEVQRLGHMLGYDGRLEELMRQYDTPKRQ